MVAMYYGSSRVLYNLRKAARNLERLIICSSDFNSKEINWFGELKEIVVLPARIRYPIHLILDYTKIERVTVIGRSYENVTEKVPMRTIRLIYHWALRNSNRKLDISVSNQDIIDEPIPSNVRCHMEPYMS